MRRSTDPMQDVGSEGSRPQSAPPLIVSMSLRLAIPRRVALQQSPLPLRQPSVSLRKRSWFEKNKSFNGKCSYAKVSHGRGPPQDDDAKSDAKVEPRWKVCAVRVLISL